MSACDVCSMCVTKWSKGCCASQSFLPKHFSCVGCVCVRYFIPKLYVLCEVHGIVYVVKLNKQLSIRCTDWHYTIGWECYHEMNTSFGVQIQRDRGCGVA
jgi:hypothetical protein